MISILISITMTCIWTWVGWTISVETLSSLFPLLSWPVSRTQKGFLGTESTNPTSSSTEWDDEVEEELSFTCWRLSPSAPSSITWLKDTPSSGARPVTASTRKAGTPKINQKQVCLVNDRHISSCDSETSLIMVGKSTVPYLRLDSLPLWPNLDVSHWWQWQSNTGNPHGFHLEEQSRRDTPQCKCGYIITNVLVIIW